MSKTILVVDDSERLRTLVQSYLAQEGFRMLAAADGREALWVAHQTQPDLIILDLMMPEMNGTEFMRTYGREADTPIIILTAKVTENDKVLGLELGADDYITKPFSMRELTARVRAVLRRVDKRRSETEILQVGDIVLNRTYRLVTVNNKPVDLTPSEFDLLAALIASPGRAFSRVDLLDHLPGSALEGYERTVDVHIRNLRAKIEPDSRKPRYIETVFGIGYRFAIEI